MSLNVTVTPASDVDPAAGALTPFSGPRFVPMRVRSWFGAMGPAWIESALSRTQLICGPVGVVVGWENATEAKYAPGWGAGPRFAGNNGLSVNGMSGRDMAPLIQTEPSDPGAITAELTMDPSMNWAERTFPVEGSNC